MSADDEWLEGQERLREKLLAEIWRLEFRTRKYTHPRPSTKNKRPTTEQYKKMNARLAAAHIELERLYD